MMLALRLFYEFFKVGLFAVGGGLATIPFLERIGEATGWFTHQQLTTMIAVAESTPGPLGVNMATFVGTETMGIPGSVVATLGLITPSVIVILIIAGFLQKFRTSKTVDRVFYGLRPASTALVTAAGLRVALSIFIAVGGVMEHPFAPVWPAICLAVAVFVLMRLKWFKKLHPIVFIGVSAVVGIVLGM